MTPPSTPPAPLTGAQITAAITPAPPKAGQRNVLTLTVTGSDGKPLAGATVKAAVQIASMDVGTSHPAFKDLGGGRYQTPVAFAMSGPWRVTVTITPPGGGPAAIQTLDYGVGR